VFVRQTDHEVTHSLFSYNHIQRYNLYQPLFIETFWQQRDKQTNKQDKERRQTENNKK